VESLAGDVFLLGTTSWRIKRVEPGAFAWRMRTARPRPSPSGMAKRRAHAELSSEVARVRGEIERRDKEPAIEFLQQECGVDRRGAEQAVDYVRAGCVVLGTLPDQSTVVAERFFDESGGMQLILHAPFGSRVNRAWGLALRKRFCRSFNFELQAAATDNGIVISLSDQHSFPLEAVFGFLHPDSVEYVLTQAMLDAPMFSAAGAGTPRARWPSCGSRAAGRSRLRFSACARTICSPRCSPIR